MFTPALLSPVENEEKGKHAAGPYPSKCWKGGRSGRVSSSLAQGTYEANCQKVLVPNDSIGKCVALLDRRAPRSGGRTNPSKPNKLLSSLSHSISIVQQMLSLGNTGAAERASKGKRRRSRQMRKSTLERGGCRKATGGKTDARLQITIEPQVHGHIHHPIRRLRRHLPYLGKADYQAAFGRRDPTSCPFRPSASFPEGKPLAYR